MQKARSAELLLELFATLFYRVLSSRCRILSTTRSSLSQTRTGWCLRFASRPPPRQTPWGPRASPCPPGAGAEPWGGRALPPLPKAQVTSPPSGRAGRLARPTPHEAGPGIWCTPEALLRCSQPRLRRGGFVPRFREAHEEAGLLGRRPLEAMKTSVPLYSCNKC